MARPSVEPEPLFNHEGHEEHEAKKQGSVFMMHPFDLTFLSVFFVYFVIFVVRL